MIHIPDLVSANRESLAAKPADVVAGVAVEDVGGDGGVEGSVASSLAPPSNWSSGLLLDNGDQSSRRNSRGWRWWWRWSRHA